MAIGNILGNIGMGLVRGDQLANEEARRANEDARRANEDKRNAEAAAFMQEQRGWQRQDRSKADELEAALKGVRPAGDYDSVDPLAAAEGVDPSMLPKVKVSRSDADVFRDQARVFQGLGKPNEAAQLVTLARGERKGAREDKQNADRDAAFLNYGKMMSMLQSPDGHVAFAKQYGPMFNADTIGGEQFRGMRVHFDPDHKSAVFIDKDGKVAGQAPWTSAAGMQAAKMMLEGTLAGISAEDYVRGESLGMQRGALANQTKTADAAKTTADATNEYRKAQAPLFQAQANAANAQAGYYSRRDAEGNAAAAANKELSKLGAQYAALSDEEKRGPAGRGIIQQAAIIKGRIDPLTVFGDNKPAKPAIGMKELKDFVDTWGDQPSNEKDNATGLPIPIRKLPIAKQRAYAEQLYAGAGAGGEGALPVVDAPKRGAPQASPATQAAAAQAPVLGVSGEKQQRERSYQMAVDALTQQQQGLARAIPSASPAEQLRMSQQIQSLGDQIRATQRDALGLGVQTR